jgi:hypothetical protein
MNTFGKELLKGVIDFTFTQNTFYNKEKEKVKISFFKLEKLNILLGKQSFDMLLFIVHSENVVLIYGINSINQNRVLLFSKKYDFAISNLGSYGKNISTIVIISNQSFSTKNVKLEDNYGSAPVRNFDFKSNYSNKYDLISDGLDNSLYLYSQVKGKFILNLIFEKIILSYTCNIDFLIIKFIDEMKIYCNETKKFIFKLSINKSSLYDLSNSYLAVYNSTNSDLDSGNKAISIHNNSSTYSSYLENCVTWGKQINDIYNLSLEIGGKNKISKLCYVTIFFLDEIKKVLVDSSSSNCYCTSNNNINNNFNFNDKNDKGLNFSESDLLSILNSFSVPILIPFFDQITELNFVNGSLITGVNGQVFYIFDLFPTSHLKYHDHEFEGKNYSSFRDIQNQGFKLSPRKMITNNTDCKLSFTLFRGYTTSTICNTDSCSNFLTISTGNGSVHLYYLPGTLQEDFIENIGKSNENHEEEVIVNPKEAVYLDKISYSSILNKNSKVVVYSSITMKQAQEKNKDNYEETSSYPIITILVMSGESLIIDYYYYDVEKKNLVKINSDSIDNNDLKHNDKYNSIFSNNISDEKEQTNNKLTIKFNEFNNLNNNNFNNTSTAYLNSRQLELIPSYKYNSAIETKTFNKCISDIHHNPIFKVSLHKKNVYSKLNINNNSKTSQIFYSQRRKSIDSCKEDKNDNLIKVNTTQLYIIKNSITIINLNDNILYDQIFYGAKCLKFLSFSQTNDKSEYNMIGKSNLLSQSLNYNCGDYMDSSKCPKVVINFNNDHDKNCELDKSSFYENKEIILKNNIKQAMESSFKKNEKDVVVFSSKLNFDENYMS